jgi:hypothetical protein
MTTVVVNQIEMQFVHQSAAERRGRLERPVRLSRVGGVAHDGFRELPFAAPLVSPDLQHELDRNEEFRAAESDRLSEIE